MKTFPIHPAVPMRWLPNQKTKLSLNGSTPLYDYLTRREIEIIRLLSEEHDSEEVAGMLCISRNTVDTHRKNIMKKLNTRSVVGIVRFAFKNGLIKI
jgi:DNA-binding CsgD family transcriptional regulator